MDKARKVKKAKRTYSTRLKPLQVIETPKKQVQGTPVKLERSSEGCTSGSSEKKRDRPSNNDLVRKSREKKRDEMTFNEQRLKELQDENAFLRRVLDQKNKEMQQFSSKLSEYSIDCNYDFLRSVKHLQEKYSPSFK